MSQESPETNATRPPWQDGENDTLAFGAWLRRERELRKVKLGDIAETTKISRRYLEALEEDRFDLLPAPVFARGFLREYALYVGLDPDEVVNSFLSAAGEEEDNDAVVDHSVRMTPFPWRWIAALAALLLVLGAVGWWFWNRDRSGAVSDEGNTSVGQTLAADADEGEPVSDPTATDSAGGASATSPAGQTPVQPPERVPSTVGTNAPLVVTLDFQGDCWVEAEVDGQRRLSELHVQGESLTIEASERVVLTLGNPNEVQILANGEPFSMGTFAEGRIARDIEIVLPTADEAGGADR